MLDMSKLARFAQKQRENDKAASDNSDARSSVLTEQQEKIPDAEAYEKAEIYIPPEMLPDTQNQNCDMQNPKINRNKSNSDLNFLKSKIKILHFQTKTCR